MGGRTLAVAVAVAFAMALFAPQAVVAQAKVIELTYGTPYGPDHTFSKTDQKWFQKIEKETGGKVKFKAFWGGAIIGPRGDAIDEIVKGVADVGFISTGQARSGYDIAKANFLFFAGTPMKEGYAIFRKVLEKYPEIEKEYKGLKVMCWSSGTQYDLLSRTPVRKLDDMKGMRVKTLGEIVDVLKDLGVEGLASPMSEVYMSMQKGILSGAFTTYSTLKVLRFAEVAKYYTELGLYRAHSGGRVMSLATWNKLPPDVQKVFADNVDWYSREADADVMKDDLEGKEFGKANGVEFITLSKADMDRFYDLILRDAKKEAANVDKKGLPGTKVLEEVQRLIKTGGK